MKYRLHITPSRCIGCRTCEIACAFSHPVEGGGMGHSRITVHDQGDSVFIPVVCLQCEMAACIKACPVQALVRNFETGAVDVIEEKCVKCNQCVAACPFGNIISQPVTLDVIKCDLCQGSPKCAMFCPTKALEYLPIETTVGAAP